MTRNKLKLGLIVNPWAGIGGTVALKGSDGQAIRDEALKLGAQPKAEQRLEQFLTALNEVKSDISFLTFPLSMGESTLKKHGFDYQVLAEERVSTWGQSTKATTPMTSAEDSCTAAQQMANLEVDLLLFVGGDGTARDVARGLKERPGQICLGIPAGVKIQSAVYAKSPESAGEIVKALSESIGLVVHSAEVRDINEEKLREGHIESKFFAELKVPSFPAKGLAIQGTKLGSAQYRYDEQGSEALIQEQLIQEEIAASLFEKFDFFNKNKKDSLFIVGGGETTQAFKRLLIKASKVDLNDKSFSEGDSPLEGTLLGVDVFLNTKCLIKDASEREILDLFLQHPTYLQRCHIVVSVIGGQGCVFGRGNQQISAAIIQQVIEQNGKEGINIVASQAKLSKLAGSGSAPETKECLFVDTGDADLDQKLCGSYLVLTDYDQAMLCKISS
jgi:predicted polyphosphate/ATP-dependent NAD kinase